MKHILLVGDDEGYLKRLEFSNRGMDLHVQVPDKKFVKGYDLIALAGSSKVKKYFKNHFSPGVKDKFSTYQKLVGVPWLRQPKTMLFEKGSSLRDLECIVEMLDFPDRIIAKPNGGSCSKNIKAPKPSKKSLKKLFEFMSSVDEDYVVSEYVEPFRKKGLKVELRLFYSPIVRGGEYGGPLFISSVQRAAKGTTQKLACEEESRYIIQGGDVFSRIIKTGDLALDRLYKDTVNKKIYHKVLALDILLDKNKDNYLLEVNSAPGIFEWGTERVKIKIVKDFKKRFIPELIACVKYK